MKEPLLSLAPSELRDLAKALEAERLAPPYSALTLQRFVTRERADEVAISLSEITESGCTALALARLLGILASAEEQRPRLEDLVDLVATGPEMIEDEPRATGVVVSDLFRKAEKSVLVAGYSVHQGQKVFRELANRMAERPELQVRLYLDIQRGNGDTSLPNEIVRRFSDRFRKTQWPAERPIPEIYFDPRSVALDQSRPCALHAKCVVVDIQHVFISSANFTEAAQERNIEMGLLLNSSVLARRVTAFFDQLVMKKLLRQIG